MKNKKILIGLLILIGVAALFFVVFIFNKPEEVKMPIISQQSISKEKKIDEDRVQAELRKKIETENIELSIEGVVNSISKETINITTLDGQELNLKILQKNILESVNDTDGPVEIDSEGKVVKKGTVFMKKNGENFEEIKDFTLENISQGQKIGIIYMTLSKEIVQITVE